MYHSIAWVRLPPDFFYVQYTVTCFLHYQRLPVSVTKLLSLFFFSTEKNYFKKQRPHHYVTMLNYPFSSLVRGRHKSRSGVSLLSFYFPIRILWV